MRKILGDEIGRLARLLQCPTGKRPVILLTLKLTDNSKILLSEGKSRKKLFPQLPIYVNYIP
jgi:hypothetical protein